MWAVAMADGSVSLDVKFQPQVVLPETAASLATCLDVVLQRLAAGLAADVAAVVDMPAASARANPLPGLQETLDGNVWGCITRMAAQHADRPAIVSAGISYKQLLHAARALGARLTQHGVHPGDRVAVAIDKQHPELLTTILAVWSIGAVYVCAKGEKTGKRRRRRRKKGSLVVARHIKFLFFSSGAIEAAASDCAVGVHGADSALCLRGGSGHGAAVGGARAV